MDRRELQWIRAFAILACLVLRSVRSTHADPASPEPAPRLQHRFIAPPGVEPHLAHEWSRPPVGLGTKRVRLEPKDAAAIEAQLVPWLRAQREAGDLDLHWASQLLLYRKLRGREGTGDKVAIFGFDRSLFEPSESITIHSLMKKWVTDGGCSLWRVLYDVRTHSFESFECNGEA